MEYDFLIVGAGLYGAVFAHEAQKKGKKCLVIDKRHHLGGNTYCENHDGINVHKYGAHIFHTNDKGIWDYVNSFVTFNRYTNSPLAFSKGRIYNLPFNMNTFHQIWGAIKPEEAKNIIEEQIKKFGVSKPKNLEEQAINLVGKDIYELLIREYTEKQWGRSAKELPAFIIKRLPLRFTYDNNYFNDSYQGIPIGGYNPIIKSMLNGIEVRLNADYFQNRNKWNTLAHQIVYTGKIDEFFDYKYGSLEYRSLTFEHQYLDIPDFQGNAVVNYSDKEYPYTRVLEHKHFEFGTQQHTVITHEYPSDNSFGKEPYYPVNDAKNNLIYSKYASEAILQNKVIFGGRLAEYKYYDMHQVIAASLKETRKIY